MQKPMNVRVNVFWWRWLIAVTVGVMLFSLSMVFLPAQIQSFFNTLVFPSTDVTTLFSDSAVHYITFVYGVLGAVMFGWMVAILFIIYSWFRRGEREAWYAVLLSILLWFGVDSIWSLYSGFAVNALLNCVFLVAFIIPLAATYRDFHPREQG